MAHHPQPILLKSATEISRRQWLQWSLCSATGVLLIDRLGLAINPKIPATQPNASAKSVIQIWMWGGPCHMDTFDPKPDAGYDYCGQLSKPIGTNVAGMQICELLPLLAKQADKFSLIRSMTHGNNGHETASYMVQTGRAAGGRVVYPCIGAVDSYCKGFNGGYKGLIPPYIVLTEPQGRFSECGFLGSRYNPFSTGGDPSQNRFMVEGVVSPNLTDQQQRDRRRLMHTMNTLQDAIGDDAQLKSLARAEEQAYDLILGDAGKVFDLSQEKQELRDRYGRSKFGQSCLVARRLVERGVPYITINYNGWDTHKQHFQTMRNKLPEFDKGLSTLLSDLKERGLLESTVIWCCGEFGRTPKVMWEPPWNGGRGHWGKVFSALVAGGGFKGGHVVGASSAKGEEVKDRPVYPCDLLASIYQLIGIDANAKLPHPQGLDCRVVPTAEEKIPHGGILKEIM